MPEIILTEPEVAECRSCGCECGDCERDETCDDRECGECGCGTDPCDYCGCACSDCPCDDEWCDECRCGVQPCDSCGCPCDGCYCESEYCGNCDCGSDEDEDGYTRSSGCVCEHCMAGDEYVTSLARGVRADLAPVPSPTITYTPEPEPPTPGLAADDYTRGDMYAECRAGGHPDGWYCERVPGHEGLHGAFLSRASMRITWGEPERAQRYPLSEAAQREARAEWPQDVPASPTRCECGSVWGQHYGMLCPDSCGTFRAIS